MAETDTAMTETTDNYDQAPDPEDLQLIGTIANVYDERTEAPEVSLLTAAQAAQAAGKPLMIKTSLHLYDVSKQSYIGWRGQAWKASLSGVDAARKFKAALDTFFHALGVLGPDRLIAVLKQAVEEKAA